MNYLRRNVYTHQLENKEARKSYNNNYGSRNIPKLRLLHCYINFDKFVVATKVA